MLKIAVIGSGMAGLAAARILKDAGHEIVVFEALKNKGMDSHSLHFEHGHIDSPLRVMNPDIWCNTLALAQTVGIKTFQVNTYMSCNWLESLSDPKQQGTWLSTQRTTLGRLPILKDWQLSKSYIPHLIKGLAQFQIAYRQFKQLADDLQQHMTLAQFMNRYQIDAYFWHGCIMPVLYTLCTCDAKTLANWTAKPLLDFLIKMQKGAPLLRMYGGTQGFVAALSQDLTFYSDAKVTQVIQKNDQYVVKNAKGIEISVDKVIVATPTHIIDFLDEEKFAPELNILRQYQFIQGELVIHIDQRCMPKQQKHWSALSYFMNQQFEQQMFSVWLNAVEPSLQGKTPIFQTWNPTFSLDPAKIIDRVKLIRAVVDCNTAKNTQMMKHIQTQPRDVYFCGAWMCEGLPILESAVTSAMFIAEQITGDKVQFPAFKLNTSSD